MIGKDPPCVSFDLEVGAGFRVLLEVSESCFGVIEGGGQRSEWLGVEGNVEMDPCFARSVEW